MSVSARQKIAVAVAGTLAVGLLGYTSLSSRSASNDVAPVVSRGTVTALPSKPIDIVDLTTPAQAAIAVSSRLFASADLAVLTDDEPASKKAAISAATRLKVPVLLDDPAAPAELTRLRATRVLTFGTVAEVVGGVAAETNRSALDSQLADLQADQSGEVARAPETVVLVKSTTAFDVAAAAATIAGATVLQTSQGDLRRDAKTAAALAEQPKAPIIALGAPFTGSLAYSLAAVQQGATQIGGGYYALAKRRYVAFHGIVDDRTSGILGQQDLAATLDRVALTASKFAEIDPATVVPTLEVVAASASTTPGSTKPAKGMSLADLTTVVDAAEKADVYVLIDVQPGDGTFVAAAKAYESLLERDHVGLTLEPAASKDAVSASEINQTSTWLADLTLAGGLPQKLFVVREDPAATPITGRASIDTSRPELAVVLGVDVAGSPAAKLAAWSAARSDAPKGTAFGWMLYTERDAPMLTVRRTYRQIDPYPALLTYQ